MRSWTAIDRDKVKPRRKNSRRGSKGSRFLGCAHPHRARALLAGLDLERDGLAAVQGVEVERAVETAAVKEVLLPVLGRDEAEAAVTDDLLDCSVWHLPVPSCPSLDR